MTSQKINYYIDSSALFKRYIKESGTEQLDRLFNSSSRLIISNMVVIEMISYLKKMYEIDRIISWNIYEALRNGFFNDISTGNLVIEPIGSKDILNGLDLIEKEYMTPIDSLQLSVAHYLKEKLGAIVFVSADTGLCDKARRSGLDVFEVV